MIPQEPQLPFGLMSSYTLFQLCNMSSQVHLSQMNTSLLADDAYKSVGQPNIDPLSRDLKVHQFSLDFTPSWQVRDLHLNFVKVHHIQIHPRMSGTSPPMVESIPE